jgi:hypothetical protein
VSDPESIRARRIRANLDRLTDLAPADSSMADRLTEHLEEEMARDYAPVKLPPDLLDRAEALRPYLDKHRELIAYGRLTRTAVIRLALVRGLADLERELVGGGVGDVP